MLSTKLCLLIMSLGSIQPFAGGEGQSHPKICIVGGGLSGSSAAYYLRKHFGEQLHIDVYESGTVGGRLATVNIAGREYDSGASMIHPRNQYVANFTQMLNLRARVRSAAGRAALYDGEDLVFTTSDYTYVTIGKLLWRYGLSIFYLEDLIQHSINDFDRIYSHQAAGHAFTTPERLLGSLSAEFLQQLETSIDSYLSQREYDQTFIDEFIMAVMLTNYGQSTTMQAFAGSVAMGGSQSGLWSIHGGNKMMPMKLIESSKVNLIGAKVRKVTLLANGKYKVTYEESGVEHSMEYDVVILASPLEVSGVKLENLPEENPAVERKFLRTVATFVHGIVNASYFGFSSQDDLTKSILSTNPDLFFNSIGYQDAADFGNHKEAPIDFSKKSVWKVFSKKPLAPDELDRIFTDRDEVKVMDWLAYPCFTSQPFNQALPKFELHDNLYYANAMEWAASAMEVLAIAGRNTAQLTINHWEGNLDKIDSSETKAPGVRRVEL